MSKSEVTENKLETLAECEEEILEVRDELRATLEDNLIGEDGIPTETTLMNSIKYPLAISIDDPEQRETIAYTLANTILGWGEDYAQILKEKSETTDFVRLMLTLSSRFQTVINDILLVDNQGSNFWNNIESEIVIRQSGAPGLNHHMEVGPDGEELELTMSADSNIRFANYILRQEIRLLESNNEAVEFLDNEPLEQLRDQVTELFEKIRDQDE